MIKNYINNSNDINNMSNINSMNSITYSDSMNCNNSNNSMNSNNSEIEKLRDDLQNYENLLKDITKKITKLQKRIIEPKYESKKSLYLSDLEKCHRRKRKLDKNIAICKNKLSKAGIKPKQDSLQQLPQQQLPQQKEPRSKSPRIEIEKQFNIPITLPLLEDKSLPINNSIEKELSSLETELNLSNTILPTEKFGNENVKNKNIQNNNQKQKLKQKQSNKERSPIAVSTQIKTISCHRVFFSKGNKRIFLWTFFFI